MYHWTGDTRTAWKRHTVLAGYHAYFTCTASLIKIQTTSTSLCHCDRGRSPDWCCCLGMIVMDVRTTAAQQSLLMLPRFQQESGNLSVISQVAMNKGDGKCCDCRKSLLAVEPLFFLHRTFAKITITGISVAVAFCKWCKLHSEGNERPVYQQGFIQSIGFCCLGALKEC